MKKLKEGISAVPKSVGDCGRGQQNNRWQPIPRCLTCPEQVRNTTQYPVTFTHLSSSSPPVITSAQVVPKPIIIQTPQVTHQRDHQTPQYPFPFIPHVHHTPLITTTSSSTPDTFPFSNTLNAASRKPHTSTRPINNPHPRPSYTYKLVTKQKSKNVQDKNVIRSQERKVTARRRSRMATSENSERKGKSIATSKTPSKLTPPRPIPILNPRPVLLKRKKSETRTRRHPLPFFCQLGSFPKTPRNVVPSSKMSCHVARRRRERKKKRRDAYPQWEASLKRRRRDRSKANRGRQAGVAQKTIESSSSSAGVRGGVAAEK